MEDQRELTLTYRPARLADTILLARMNRQLIEDEAHGSFMTIPELVSRMRLWLSREFQGVLFERDGEVVAYAVYRLEQGAVYLRQFFVSRQHRRQGIGRAAMHILLHGIFPRRARVTVEVLYDNHTAHEFWRAVGFKDFAVTLEICP
jgi:ribosomal protein S18 acetylase RimI-like enzyme